jgi:hypothetical protein
MQESVADLRYRTTFNIKEKQMKKLAFIALAALSLGVAQSYAQPILGGIADGVGNILGGAGQVAEGAVEVGVSPVVGAAELVDGPYMGESSYVDYGDTYVEDVE